MEPLCLLWTQLVSIRSSSPPPPTPQDCYQLLPDLPANVLLKAGISVFILKCHEQECENGGACDDE